MKIFAVILASLAGCNGSLLRPQVSLTIQDGNFGTVEGLDPKLSWSSSATSTNVDLTYGLEAKVRPTWNIAGLTKKLWGKASSTCLGSGINFGIEATLKGMNPQKAVGSFDVDVINDDIGTAFQFHGTFNDDAGLVDLRTIQASKSFTYDGADFNINSQYNIPNDEKKLVASYNKNNLNLKLAATGASKSLTVSSQIDEENRVSPTFSSDGSLSVEWEHQLHEDSTIVTTYKPDDYIHIQWKENKWTTNMNLPLDELDGGNLLSGGGISFKRDVQF